MRQEINPYQSPEAIRDTPRAPPEPRIRFYALAGVVIGLVLGFVFTGLSLWVEPPVLTSDIIEVLPKSPVVCASVGFIVGLLWGLFRVMHAPSPE